MLAAVSFAGVGTADRSMLPLLAAVSFAGVDVGFVPTDSAAARAGVRQAGGGCPAVALVVVAAAYFTRHGR